MVAALVGVSSWSASPVVPSGGQSGDVLVLASTGDWRESAPDGWDLRASRLIMQGLFYFWRSALWTRRWEAGLSAPSVKYGRLLLLRGVSLPGRTNPASAGIQVVAGGAAVILDVRNPAASWSGWSWFDASSQITVGSSTLYARVGWGGSAGGGLVGQNVVSPYALTLELLPPPAPSARWVLPTANAEVSSAGSVDLEWLYQPAQSGGTQRAYRLRLGSQWWNAATGALVASAVDNASSATRLTIPAALFTEGVAVVRQVQVQEALDEKWSELSDAWTFTPVAPPTVSVTQPGNLVDDLSPTVAFTRSTPRGSQIAFRVWITRADGVTVLRDSGVQAGAATSWNFAAESWPENALSLLAWVTVQQTGESWSVPVSKAFALSWTEPPAPTISAVPTATGVAVAVVATGGLTVEVQRLLDGEWTRVALFVATGGQDRVHDLFTPWGVGVRYRANAATLLEGQRLVSSWVLSETVASVDMGAAVASALDPARTWLRLPLRTDEGEQPIQGRSIMRGLGAAASRGDFAEQQGWSGQSVFLTESRAERDWLLALVTAGEPLLLRLPTERESDGTVRPGAVRTILVSDDPAAQRVAQSPVTLRDFPISWVTTRPVAPDQSQLQFRELPE